MSIITTVLLVLVLIAGVTVLLLPALQKVTRCLVLSEILQMISVHTDGDYQLEVVVVNSRHFIVNIVVVVLTK